MAKKRQATSRHAAAPAERVRGGLVRRSITLDVVLDREAHRLSKHKGFSALVAEALTQRIKNEKMLRYLDELDEKYGPSLPEDVTEAEEAWQKFHGSP